MVKFTSDYSLRTWTTACYYYNEHQKAWIANGMGVSHDLFILFLKNIV